MGSFVVCGTTARSLLVWTTRDDRSERSAEILEPIETFFDYVDAGGVAEANRAIIAEGRARNDRDVRFAQQTIGEILRSQPELADVHQHVKCALRFDRGDVRDL